MALDGRAPKFMRFTMNGVPVVCLAFTMIFPCLSFLQVSNGSAKVLDWLSVYTTGRNLLNSAYLASRRRGCWKR